MKLIIKYGKRFEINRIKSTIKKLEWYKAHNYKPILPKAMATEEEIISSINKEFNEKEFENAKDNLLKDYAGIKKAFAQKLKDFFKIKIPSEIEIMLTKYGMGGSYNLPNIIILNIQSKKQLIDIFKHEILHLFLEEDVNKRGLSQEEKERLIEETERKFD